MLVDVVVPTKLTKRQRELLTELAAEGGEEVDGAGGIREKLGLG